MVENNKNEKEIELEGNEIVRISVIRIPGSDEFSVYTAVREEDPDAKDIVNTMLEAIDDAYEEIVSSNEKD